MMRKQLKQKGRKQTNRNAVRVQAIPHPPPIQPQVTHRQRMRFAVTTAQARASFTFQNLLDTINIAATAVTAFDLFDQVRVNFVEIWAAPVQGAAPQQVALEYSGATVGTAGDGRLYSDSSMGVEPAHVRAAPARLSQAALWQASSANTAFQLTAPIASIIDVDLSFRTVQSDAPVAVQNVPAGAAAGQLYFRGLDGLAIAATQLPPVTPGPQD
jgi:hypothetical protein